MDRHEIIRLFCTFRDDGFHTECSCGWVSSPHDEADALDDAMRASRKGREHVAQHVSSEGSRS